MPRLRAFGGDWRVWAAPSTPRDGRLRGINQLVDERGRHLGTSGAAITRAGSGKGLSPRREPKLCDLAQLTESVEIGFDAPGFVRPSYGLGVMTDPGRPGGFLLGHGGCGPDYAAATFAVLREGGDPLVAIELSADERVDVPGARAGRTAARYLRLNDFRTGALVRPDVSRTAIVTV